MKDGTLILNVVHGKEIEIEYEKNKIMDKINSFFGYDCITSVKLKIVQAKIDKQKKILRVFKDLDKIEKKIQKINDNQLKISLNNFLKAYNEKDK